MLAVVAVTDSCQSSQPVLHPPPGTSGSFSGFIYSFQNLLATTVTSLISHTSRTAKGCHLTRIFFRALFLLPLVSTTFWVRKLPAAFVMVTRELFSLDFSTQSFFGTVLKLILLV